MKLLAALLGAATLHPGAASGWHLDPNASLVSFVSVANGHEAAINRFTGLSGHVIDDWEVRVDISLASLLSGQDTRDEQVRNILFRVAEFPVLTVMGEVDMAELARLAPGTARQIELPVHIATYGGAAAYDAQVLVTRAGDDRVVVASLEPVIVHASDLGFDTGISKLQSLTGLGSIQSVVPVSFVLSFSR